MTGRTKGATLALAAALLLPAAAAQAATKTVSMGEPAKYVKTFNTKYSADVNDFFPHGVSIHVGDTVKWVPVGFHNVDIPAKGAGPRRAIVSTGRKVNGVNDAAGQPFWFNGFDELGFAPALVKVNFGKTLSYNGKKRAESGLPLAPKPKPFGVKFRKTGSFTYYCDLHPGMKGTVKVLPKSKKVRTRKADAAVVKRMVTRDMKEAKGLRDATVPAGVVDVGNASPHGVSFFGFLPKTITVNAGTTITFRMLTPDTETHTATTGPGNPETEPNSYLGQIATGFPADQRGDYPSDAPGTPAKLTPSLHGNGFWNSGALDASSRTPEAPASNSVTFSAAGSYDVYCLVHPFMKGTVIVR